MLMFEKLAWLAMVARSAKLAMLARTEFGAVVEVG